MFECRYHGWCRIEYDNDFGIFYPCIGDGADVCMVYEPMPDVGTLLELADELERPMRDGGYSKKIARRIRGALGVGE